MLTVGPVTVTATAFTVRPQTGNTTQLIFSRVVLSNHSQYLLEIRNGSIRAFLDPWTVNVFPYSSDQDSDILCTPSLISTLIIGASSYLTAQFYQETEPDIGVAFPSPITSPIDAALAVAQQGAPAIDIPVLLGFAFLTNLNAGATAVIGTFAITSYSSFFSWYGWDAPVGTFLRVTLTWKDSTTATVDEDEIVINGQGAGSPTTAGGAYIRGPVRGTSLSITFKNEGLVAANYNYDFNGSLRVVTGLRCIENNATANLLFEGQITPGGLSNMTQWLPLVSGFISTGFQAVGTNGQNIRLSLRTGITNSLMFDRTYLIGTTAPDYALQLIFPRIPMNLFVDNLGASAINGIRCVVTVEDRS